MPDTPTPAAPETNETGDQERAAWWLGNTRDIPDEVAKDDGVIGSLAKEFAMVRQESTVILVGQRPSPADEMTWLRSQVERLSAEKITLLAALELAAPHLCGDECLSVRKDDGKPWPHCDECKTVTDALGLGEAPTLNRK